MTEYTSSPFGSAWFDALAATTRPTPNLPGSIRVGESTVDGERAALVAVVPDPDARFPRARNGEMGLEEGWAFASAIQHIIEADRADAAKRPIVIVVDVPSQAYGYVEELAGIHQSLAAAADAVATARLVGHPVTALVVGKAISGAFLAIGLQANRIVLLEHSGIVVQVMSKQSAARITRRTVAQLDEIAERVPATAYDGGSFAKLGAVHAVISIDAAAQPTAEDVTRVLNAVAESTRSARAAGASLDERLESDAAATSRGASRLVRSLVAAEWNG